LSLIAAPDQDVCGAPAALVHDVRPGDHHDVYSSISDVAVEFAEFEDVGGTSVGRPKAAALTASGGAHVADDDLAG
jgi:hypothetical protein